ncbi:Transporter, sodium/sulfate symporter family [hydrothermal vent metagenome]|uniref:Transporter, sodium/sulfate symporter family n=1 Tax=hydrothermal vent metagenome TaxID=652676 RepID=A0A3B0VNB4_9ZZZZ
MEMAALELNNEMMMVLAILAYTIVLFVTEVIRIDVAAILILVVLGLTGLVPDNHLFDGFASNAVLSIIAVMILGAGLDRTGIMNKVASFILKIGGQSEKTVIPVVSSTVGVISGFMQNVGATALFLPVMSRISSQTKITLSRLLMPMGFCAILGGTITMVGSSPLILLNDLLETSNRSLPPGAETLKPFDLFSVTPIGISLLIAGILYFLLIGRFLLPKSAKLAANTGGKSDAYFKKTYDIHNLKKELIINKNSPLIGKTILEIETIMHDRITILALNSEGHRKLSPSRKYYLWSGDSIGVLGEGKEIEDFADKYDLTIVNGFKHFKHTFSESNSGFSEAVIVPGSRFLGKSLSDFHFRKEFGITIVAISRANEVFKGEDMHTVTLRLGDTFVVFGGWRDQAGLGKSRNVALVGDIPTQQERPQKVPFALFFFALALGLVIFTDFKLSIALLTGAIGMIISGVIHIDEAYRAVSWKTVFLLACLIPLGYAMEHTGTAAWIAQQTIAHLGNVNQYIYQLAIAILATIFSLVMSNVGATVLLVPLAINIALETGGNPALYALIVALSTSNAFILPTHQVSALIMGPGGYKVKDFLRVGSLMSVIFIIVMLVAVNIFGA